MKKYSLLSNVKIDTSINEQVPPEQTPDGSLNLIKLNEKVIDLALEKFYANRDEAMREYERQQCDDIADLVRSLNEAEI